MIPRSRFAAVLVVVLFLALAPAVFAAEATTTADETIDIQKLDVLLEPLTADELLDEITAGNGWLSMVKQVGKDLAQAKLGDESRGTVAELSKKRSELVKRLEAVIDALAAKGGDEATIKGFTTYLDAISGAAMPELAVDMKNPSATMTKIVNWAKDPEGGLKIAKSIIFFILLLIAFKILAAILGGITRRAVGRLKNVSQLLRDFFVNTVKKVTMLIGIIVALGVLGIEVGPFVAAIGAVGFIVGFALQGTLSNFASGIMILLYRPYDIGDVVTVSGVTGKVDAMSLVSTTIKTPDNQVVVVPNNSIWGDVITNITGENTRRVDLVFGIGYEDDMAKAKAAMEEVVSGHPLVRADPAPVIEVTELADSSVNFVCRPWCKTSDYWTVYWDLTRLVKEKFDAEGISIPFPQRDVHLHEVAG